LCIHGEAGGKSLTLWNCSTTSVSQDFGPSGPQGLSEYAAIYFFLGAHLDLNSDRFLKAKLNFTNLEEWFGQSPFKQIVPPPQQFDEAIGFRFHSKTPVFLEQINAGLIFEHHYVLQYPNFDTASFSTKLFLTITPANPEKFFEYFWDNVKHFRNLLTLFIGDLTFLRDLELETSDGSSVQLFRKDRMISDSRILPRQMISSFPKIENIWSSG
jgi:hypothetical protein